MTVRLEGNMIHLIGDCAAEDGESLAALLQDQSPKTLDLSKCTALHCAIVQVVLVFRPAIAVASGEQFLADWICPALAEQL